MVALTSDKIGCTRRPVEPGANSGRNAPAIGVCAPSGLCDDDWASEMRRPYCRTRRTGEYASRRP
jgi:hypothetical protein